MQWLMANRSWHGSTRPRVAWLDNQAHQEERHETAPHPGEPAQSGHNARRGSLTLNERDHEDDRGLRADITGAARTGLEKAANPYAHKERHKPGKQAVER